jgi:hypothetical protein
MNLEKIKADFEKAANLADPDIINWETRETAHEPITSAFEFVNPKLTTLNYGEPVWIRVVFTDSYYGTYYTNFELLKFGSSYTQYEEKYPDHVLQSVLDMGFEYKGKVTDDEQTIIDHFYYHNGRY